VTSYSVVRILRLGGRVRLARRLVAGRGLRRGREVEARFDVTSRSGNAQPMWSIELELWFLLLLKSSSLQSSRMLLIRRGSDGVHLARAVSSNEPTIQDLVGIFSRKLSSSFDVRVRQARIPKSASTLFRIDMRHRPCLLVLSKDFEPWIHYVQLIFVLETLRKPRGRGGSMFRRFAHTVASRRRTIKAAMKPLEDSEIGGRQSPVTPAPESWRTTMTSSLSFTFIGDPRPSSKERYRSSRGILSSRKSVR
jgi:hypothetical protein